MEMTFWPRPSYCVEKITHLTDTSGGFYFRNNRGEELCASLTNLFMARCYVLSGDKESFHRAAETLAHDCTLTRAKSTLRIDSPLPGAFSHNVYQLQKTVF